MPKLKKIKNNLLLKIVEVAVFPSLLIFFSKIIYTFLLTIYYKLPINYTGGQYVYNNIEQFKYINSVSNLLVFLTVFAFALFYLIKAYFLHQSHIHPKFSAWLHMQQLEKLITGSYILYLKMASYGAFLWLLVIVFMFESYTGISNLSVLILSLSLTSVYTVLAIIDLERDHIIHFLK